MRRGRAPHNTHATRTYCTRTEAPTALVVVAHAGFVPLNPEVGPYSGMLVASVVIEEAVRYGVWRLHRWAQHTQRRTRHDASRVRKGVAVAGGGW